MADYIASARSNYFRVKDLGAFKREAEKYGLTVTHKDSPTNESEFVALLAEDDHGDWPTSWYDEETNEDGDVDVPDFVADHLVDGDVAVFMEAGAEKLRYVSGHAVAINSGHERRQVSLNDIYPLARELGPNVTNASY